MTPVDGVTPLTGLAVGKVQSLPRSGHGDVRHFQLLLDAVR